MATNYLLFFFAPRKSTLLHVKPTKSHLHPFLPRVLLITPSFSTSHTTFSPLSSRVVGCVGSGLRVRHLSSRRKLRSSAAVTATMFTEIPVVADICATAISSVVAISVLRFWEETAKRGLFDQKLNRKLVHVSIGLVFMLCWPMFSSGRPGAVFASLIPGINIIKMLLMGLGIWKDEATVKSMTRYGDYRIS